MIKVDIWSDIRCPFCYIGKRKFELGLEKFSGKDEVVVEWHSFELDPNLEARPGISAHEYLAERKGISLEQSVQMHGHVTNLVKEVGLRYDFSKAITANSFDAHRLIQFAKTKGLGDLAEETIFKAYFTEGKDISDKKVLKDIAIKIGLDETEAESMLNSNSFEKEVRNDEELASRIGINGVPFFIFNGKLAVSGAQAPEVFTGALEKASAG